MANERTRQSNGNKSGTQKEVMGRIPPHSIEAERAVLCSALIDPAGFARIVGVVDGKSFYDRRNGLIFEGMDTLFAKGTGIDIVTVSEVLKNTGSLESVGGDIYLVELSNEVATSSHIEHYAKIVREKYALRRLISTSSDLAERAFDTTEPDQLLDEGMQHLFEISESRAEGGFEHLSKSLKDMGEALDRYHQNKGELTGVGTGFKELDQLTSGFQNGDLIIVAARPSMGKTAFSLDLARNACLNHDVGVAFFSLEMASMALAMRLVAAQANLDLHKLRSGTLRDNQWQAVSKAYADLNEMKFFIDDSGSLTVNELRARARILKKQHDIGIVFIDYLQLMQPPRADSREQEVSKISRALKSLARELDIPVVALSQLSRAVEQRGGDHRPQLSDLRDSGAIEQDADVVMFIFRPSQYAAADDEEARDDNTSEIIVRKQRNGPTDTVELVFHKKYAHFVDKASGGYIPPIPQQVMDAEDDDEAPF